MLNEKSLVSSSNGASNAEPDGEFADFSIRGLAEQRLCSLEYLLIAVLHHICISPSMDALKQQLATIDENLVRSDLTALERAESLKRRKEIYEQMYPQATEKEKKQAGRRKGGKARHGQLDETVSPSTPAFTEDTAAKTGLTSRTIQQDIQIAENLDPEVKQVIQGTAKAVMQAITKGDAKDAKAALHRLKRAERVKALRGCEPLDNANISPCHVLYADPPWQYEFSPSTNREIENQYPTMSLQEIRRQETTWGSSRNGFGS